MLHLGCGKDPLPEWVQDRDETRLDLDPATSPDVVASILDVGRIGPFDVVYSAHVLEHVYPHEAVQALKEGLRVLNDGGCAIHIVPDLEGIAATEDVIYESEAGPITGLDMIYGYRPMLVARPYMAHKNGFTRATLEREFIAAGFKQVKVARTSDFNLLGIGIK